MKRTLRALIALIAVVGLIGMRLIEGRGASAWQIDLGYVLVALPSLLFVGGLIWMATHRVRNRTPSDLTPNP